MSGWEPPRLTRQQHISRFLLENPGLGLPDDADHNAYTWKLGVNGEGQFNRESLI